MSKADQVCYLTRDPRSFDSRLRQMLEAAKISRMPPDQWMSYIKGLGSKGVKKDDIQDARIMGWLSGSEVDSPVSGKPVEKGAVLDALERYSPTVKEVVLGEPQYRRWHHGGADAEYKEILFIANSERSNMEDRLEEIEFKMESLGFDMTPVIEDPTLVLRLEKERASLMKKAPAAVEFNWTHFTSRDIQGKHGRNLIGHARVTIHNGLFFIEEVQSDWGQSGRVRRTVNEGRRDAGLPSLDWNSGVPRGPFVTDTKLWAGLIMRRLLQRAALMPDIDRVAWIRICMKNGGGDNPRQWSEDRRVQMEAQHALAAQEAIARGEEPPPPPVDEKDHFYTRLIPSIAESAIAKAGGKVEFGEEVLNGRTYQDIPGFKMTPEVRESLKGVQPLYSAASVLRNPRPVPDAELVRLVKSARHMIGSMAHIRFIDKLYNLQDMTSMSGRQVNRMIDVALNSSNVKMALDHECYHFAHVNLLDRREQRIVLDAFARDSVLNGRVRDLLLRENQPKAAAQCDNPEEAAAHAFAYWSAGKFDLNAPEPQGVFEHLAQVICDAIQWIKEAIVDRDFHTAEDVFSALRRGDFAEVPVEDAMLSRPRHTSARVVEFGRPAEPRGFI